MIFGKHINRYYLKFAPILVLGLVALGMVDFLQLEIPKLYRMLINGMDYGVVDVNGVSMTFDLNFLQFVWRKNCGTTCLTAPRI